MSPSRLRIALAAAGVIGIVAIAFILLRGGGAAAPQNLAVGDCIDVPAAAAIATIPKRSCSEAHTGEVFHVFDAGGQGEYPSDHAWGEMIFPACDPAFEVYTGTPVETRTDIDYLYFVPTPDRWAAGDRRVTCFIRTIDGSPLLRSHRKPG